MKEFAAGLAFQGTTMLCVTTSVHWVVAREPLVVMLLQAMIGTCWVLSVRLAARKSFAGAAGYVTGGILGAAAGTAWG